MVPEADDIWAFLKADIRALGGNRYVSVDWKEGKLNICSKALN